MFTIKPAEREAAPIAAAIIGGSGSGKTYSALKFARGLVGKDGKIVVIDTEGGRPLIYAADPVLIGADGFAFHRLDLPEPYTSERFREAFREAERAGAAAIIIDTVSHEHEGFLEFAEQEEARMANSNGKSRNKWIRPKATRKRFYSAISSSRAHVILTIRLNRIVDMEAKPPKEIYKPECDKDLPYRMDLSLQLDPATHAASFIKVPAPLGGLIENGVMLEKRHGEILAQDIGQQKARTNSHIIEILRNLEDVASSGTDIFKTAWQAAWRNCGPDGDTKTMTPDRIELNKHLDRLKQIAATADTISADEAQAGGAPDGNDYGEMFPGDRL